MKLAASITKAVREAQAEQAEKDALGQKAAKEKERVTRKQCKAALRKLAGKIKKLCVEDQSCTIEVEEKDGGVAEEVYYTIYIWSPEIIQIAAEQGIQIKKFRRKNFMARGSYDGYSIKVVE